MKIAKTEIKNRLDKFAEIIKKEQLDGLLLSSRENIFYLSNFHFISFDEREALLLITKQNCRLLTALMYQSQFKNIYKNIEVVADKDGFWQNLGKQIKDKKIGFEDNDLKFNEYEFLKKSTQKLIPISKNLNKLRSQKSQYEIKKIKQTEIITKTVLESVLSSIKVSQSEKQIARKIEQKMEKLGADGLAFPTIVASGSNSGSPHHLTSDKKIKSGDIVLIDCGAKKYGYCGDMTRTIMVGTKNPKFIKTYQLVKKAQQVALSKVKAGVKIADIDKVVRNVFEKSKQLGNFLHTTGHGLGISVHEYPSISIKSKGILEEGMVITIEPGLYYPWGGVRIEDVVLVTKDGYQMLS
jgi:Xaa-Pro aminopeptidase